VKVTNNQIWPKSIKIKSR